ncbi:catalase (peroxidase I) [Hymenobacter sp. 9A]|uniref:Catalase (Peroxidase I) n=1 Tax=Hymenobacter caeli TaxID=2735894 RepID=A0ABX2FS62_9BACT|nr:catalase (peroxidase I) [Hymenobacter caeli]
MNRRTVPVIAALRTALEEFNGQPAGGKHVSLADLIVLGGCAALEKAAAAAGVATEVPFTPGRRDSTQALTDVEMFTWLKPVADGFRNYLGKGFGDTLQGVSPEEIFLDKAQLLSLTSPEWVALTGGLRAMNANHDGSPYGSFTDRVGVLTNDFFTVLTSTEYDWKKDDAKGLTFSLEHRETGKSRFVATRSDLLFGSNSQLRAVAEVFAGGDGHKRFVRALAKAWDKVMMLDRCDVKPDNKALIPLNEELTDSGQLLF